jgi:NAD(P) transhydrogenase subunit alpha
MKGTPVSLKIAILKETAAGENRVAASPETVRKLTGLKAAVHIESGAGLKADITDDMFRDAGATIGTDRAALLKGAQVVLCVQGPAEPDLDLMDKGALLVGNLNPYKNAALIKACAAKGIDACAMELVPRITRAQAMDVLSSQANLAGYKAVLEAAAHFGRAFPMMMTAAGTVPPAKVFVMGAGVAGLQAIATARRLGAVVSATDVRPAAKEQVASLGATFVAVEDEEFKQAETAGGYAKEMSAEYKAKQQALIEETIAKQDIVITTALIPGRPAPKLVTAAMVKSMKPGSVIVDMATEQGGNCELSRPGEVAEADGVTIVGYGNLPSRLAASAALLYAKNLLNLLTLVIDKESGALNVNADDDIIKGIALTRGGTVIHPQFAQAA